MIIKPILFICTGGRWSRCDSEMATITTMQWNICVVHAYWTNNSNYTWNRQMVAAGSCKWKPGVRKFAMILAGKYRWMSALEGQLHLYELTFGICLLHPNQICAVTLTYGHRQDRATPVACWWFSVSRGAFKSTTVIENSLGYSSLNTKIFITVRFFSGAALCCMVHQCDITASGLWYLGLE